MIARRSVIAASVAFLAGAARAQASVPVQGTLLSRARNTSVPGVTAFLLHPTLGRSAPSITDGAGRFGWSAIPVRREPYFLQIEWGRKVIYREQLVVAGPTVLPAILL